MTTTSPTEHRARYRMILLALMAAVTSVLAYLSNSWMVSCIGDEWAIYQRAVLVASGPPSITGEIFGPLSMGLWGVHMPFLTFCQGVVMYLLGTDNFGWRMASILSFALSIPPLFIITSVLFSRGTALLACALMALSYYLLAEALWGYGWTILRLFSLWQAAFLTLFLRKPSVLSAIALGIGLTLCSLSGALCAYITPLTFLVLAGFSILRSRPKAWLYSALVAAVFLLTHTLPIHMWSRTDDLKTTLKLTLSKTSLGPVLQQYFGTEMFSKVEGQARTIPELIELLSIRFGETILAPVTMIGGSHYLFGKVINPITGTLSMVGLALAIFLALRSWSWRLILIFFLPAVILAGALSPYSQPALTRMHFLVPFWAFLAAAAVDILTRRLPRWTFSVSATALVAINAWWAYDRVFITLPFTQRFTPQAFAIQVLQTYPDRKVAFLYGNWHPLEFALGPYGLKERTIEGTLATSDELLTKVIKEPTTLIVIPPESSEKIDDIQARVCAGRQTEACSCKSCGGLVKLPFTICGTFECSIARPPPEMKLLP